MTTTLKVTIYHRTGPHSFEPYSPGDTVEAVFTFDMDRREVVESVFAAFNGHPPAGWEERSAAYYAARNRSLSVGDLVVFGEVALACGRIGWDWVASPSEPIDHTRYSPGKQRSTRGELLKLWAATASMPEIERLTARFQAIHDYGLDKQRATRRPR